MEVVGGWEEETNFYKFTRLVLGILEPLILEAS